MDDDVVTAGVRPTVGIVITCYERTYRDVLAPGFFPAIVAMNDRAFDAVVALINNVDDSLDARRRARALVAAGELTSFAFVADHIDQARRAAGLSRRTLRRRPYLLDYGLVMPHVLDTEWLLGWDAETTLAEPVNWVDPAIALMSAHPQVFHVSLDWPPIEPGEAGLAQEAVGTIGGYTLNWGFSDQLFLLRRRDLIECGFSGFAPAAIVRHAPHPHTFEFRVECWQRAQRRPRATWSTVRYATNHLSSGVLERTGRTTFDSARLRLLRWGEFHVVKRLPGWTGPRFAKAGALGAWPPPTSPAEGHGGPGEGQRPTISLVHATDHRPGGPLPVRDLWFGRAVAPARLEYVVALDEDDTLAVRQTEGCRRVVGAASTIPTAVRNWNAAAARSTGSIIVVIADDLEPPERWDELLLDSIGRLDPTSDSFVVKVTDSLVADDRLVRHPVVSRAFYARWGLFSHAFSGVFCDDDLTRRAFWRSAILDGRNLVLRHAHPTLEPTIRRSISQERINTDDEYRVGHERLVSRWPRPALVPPITLIRPSDSLAAGELGRQRRTLRASGVLSIVAWATTGVARRLTRAVTARR